MDKVFTFRDRPTSTVCPFSLFARLGAALETDVSGADPRTREFPDVGLPGFREQYLLKELLRKYPCFPDAGDKRERAVKSLLASEEENLLSNLRIRNRNYGENPRVSQVYHLASRKAVTVLGSFDWEEFWESVRFGPGTTTRVRGSDPSLQKKLVNRPHVTPRASEMAYEALCRAPHWAFGIPEGPAGSFTCLDPNLLLEIKHEDRVTTVPKDSETDRSIAIQPDMNVYLQLGVGTMIRRRLRKVGVNLNDQSLNQRLALEGSLFDQLATVDVENASNSLCKELVWDMIGNHNHDYCDPTWFKVLSDLRTEFGEYPDGTVRFYQMFSAMGNGFTFELESLVFWALAVATCEIAGVYARVSVFGDDIILPSEAIELFEEVMSFSGFKLNRKKSFAHGPFRESCGKHYLRGVDVTPVRAKEDLSRPENVMILHNNLVRWGRSCGEVDPRLTPVLEWLRQSVPRDLRRCIIPDGVGDVGFLAPFDQARPQTVVSNGSLMGYRYRAYLSHQRFPKDYSSSGLTAWLYSDSYKQLTESGSTQIGDKFFSIPREVKTRHRRVSYLIVRRTVGAWVFE